VRLDLFQHADDLFGIPRHDESLREHLGLAEARQLSVKRNAPRACTRVMKSGR
jgi:hypothetical protein